MKQLQSISTSLNNLIKYMYEAHIRVDTSDTILRMTESYIETFTIVQNDIFNMLINESSMVRRLLQTATNDIKNGIDVSKHSHSLNNLLSNTYKYEVKINQIKQNQ